MIKWTDKESLQGVNQNTHLIKKVFNSYLKTPSIYHFFDRTSFQKSTNYWRSRKLNEKNGCQEYIKLSETSYPLLEEIKHRSSNKDDKLLDLGCNIGRHLEALRVQGFKELYGVEVSIDAKKQQKKIFPQLVKASQIAWMSFEDYLPSVEERYFDITFTHGKTIEHVHPKLNLSKEIARITNKYIIFANVALNHGEFPRFWIKEIEKENFSLVKLLQPEHEWSPKSPHNRPHALIIFARNN